MDNRGHRFRKRGRKVWEINPVERVHSTPKGRKGYVRMREKRQWKKGLGTDVPEGDLRMGDSDSPVIGVFGGSHPREDSVEYEEARRLGQLLAEAGFSVCNGGYEGTMEATSRGAKEYGGRTIGVTTRVFDPSEPNPWVDEEIKTESFLLRYERFLLLCDAFVVLKGGVGTLAELAFVWNMIQTRAIPRRPLILVGDLWKEVTEDLSRALFINRSDLGFMTIVGSAEEAVQVLQRVLSEN